MKKYWNLVFVFLFFTCIGAGILLIVTKENPPFEDIPADASETVLNITTSNTVEMVEGQIKAFFYHVNISDATVNITVENESIILLDSFGGLYALKSGTTTCTVSAIYQNQSATKSIQITVHAKNITFTELSGEGFLIYMSNKKANNVYDTYTLKISANYSLKKSSLNLSDNIVIVSTNFSSEDKTVIIQYNLLYEGRFEFLIDGFSFSKNATDYISGLDLDFVNVEQTGNEITLYNLKTQKQTAYEDKKFDYALLTKLNNFAVILENENILAYENLLFSAKDSGLTNVTFSALDGSGFELTVVFKIEEIHATDCQLNIAPQIQLTIVESVTISAENFLPVYSTAKNITLQTGENLTVDGTTLTATHAGTSWIKVFLNGNLIREIEVTITNIPINEPIYFLSIIPPLGVIVDMENSQIYLPAGLVQIRIHIYDEKSSMADVSFEIMSGSSSVYSEGCTVFINSVNNSVLRITNNNNGTYYDFDLIIT